jgi:hypothetical protein
MPATDAPVSGFIAPGILPHARVEAMAGHRPPPTERIEHFDIGDNKEWK